MAQNDILDYIRNTPHNSNVNVVKGMLNAKGGDSEPLVVHLTYDESTDTSTLDKTWQEIYDAFPNIILYDESDFVPGSQGKEIHQVHGVVGGESGYLVDVFFFIGAESCTFVTDATDGYPAYTPEP